MAILWAWSLVLLALLGFCPSAQAASPAGPSQQVLEVAGNGELRAKTVIPAGTSRFWVIRLDGDGALLPRAVDGFKIVGEPEEDVLAFESAASNSAPVNETVELTIGVRHAKWGTTRVLIRTEIGGRIADGEAGRDPWFSGGVGLAWPIYPAPTDAATDSIGNSAVGGLSVVANKPLGGSWIGLVELDTNWEGATRGVSSRSGSDWQSVRFGFGFGQYRPYGTRWSLGSGVDFGEYGVGASRPVYTKFEFDRTALPGQPWEGRAQLMGTFGSGVGFGAGAGWDFRLSGPMTVGLMTEAGANSGGSYHAGAGPAFGFNVPAWDSTLRIRTGARLGVKKNSNDAATGMIAPFLHVGMQKGN